MILIRSGTTTGRIVRAALTAALTGSLAVAFLYDGYIGYPRKNALRLAKSLGLQTDSTLVINGELTAAEAQRVKQRVNPGDPLAVVEAILGEPSLRHQGYAYYLGPGGSLRVQLLGERVLGLEWTAGPKSELDLRWQLWIGYGLSALGLVLAVRLVRVATTRVNLTATGLKLPGRLCIPFEAMTGFNGERYTDTGWVELEYTARGVPRRAKLDSYVVRAFQPIVTAICERKGFPNPLSPSKAQRKAVEDSDMETSGEL